VDRLDDRTQDQVHRLSLEGWRLVPTFERLDVSTRLKQRASKRVRVATKLNANGKVVVDKKTDVLGRNGDQAHRWRANPGSLANDAQKHH
jgi:hypothetical protein